MSIEHLFGESRFTYSQVDAALQKDAGASTYQKQADSTLTSTNPEPGANFYVSSAEQKALGLSSANASALDGYVSLSSSTQFAFNGAPQGQQVDAKGAFMHEMTEVMGRVGSLGKAVGASVYTPLDLFRYQYDSALNPSSGAQRATAAGGLADFFSINGGQRRTLASITPPRAAPTTPTGAVRRPGTHSARRPIGPCR